MQIPENGFHANIPDHVYHSWPLASRSVLKHFRQSPAHVKWAMENPGKETPALKKGRLVHSAVLEPERFESRYHFYEKFDRKSDAAKARWAAMCAQYGEHNLVTLEEREDCLVLRDVVHKHSEARRLISKAKDFELTGLWNDRLTGVRCKMRIDAILPGLALLDLKTTEDASPWSFAKAIYDYAYYRQAAFYLSGCHELGAPLDNFIIIAVEKSGPYGVAIYDIDDVSLQAGRTELEDLLGKFAACQKTDNWPSYDPGLQPIQIPDFGLKRIESNFQ